MLKLQRSIWTWWIIMVHSAYLLHPLQLVRNLYLLYLSLPRPSLAQASKLQGSQLFALDSHATLYSLFCTCSSLISTVICSTVHPIGVNHISWVVVRQVPLVLTYPWENYEFYDRFCFDRKIWTSLSDPSEKWFTLRANYGLPPLQEMLLECPVGQCGQPICKVHDHGGFFFPSPQNTFGYENVSSSGSWNIFFGCLFVCGFSHLPTSSTCWQTHLPYPLPSCNK
jgi:hypothetical protein